MEIINIIININIEFIIIKLDMPYKIIDDKNPIIHNLRILIFPYEKVIFFTAYRINTANNIENVRYDIAAPKRPNPEKLIPNNFGGIKIIIEIIPIK